MATVKSSVTRTDSLKATRTIITGAKAAQTTLKRRNGRLTSKQNNTRISGPVQRQRPTPLVTEGPGHLEQVSSARRPTEADLVSSPLDIFFFGDDTAPNDSSPAPQENHFQSDISESTVKHYLQDDEALVCSDISQKKSKVNLLLPSQTTLLTPRIDFGLRQLATIPPALS